MPDWNLALNLARLVLVASDLGTGTYGQPQFDAISALGYTFLEEIKGNDLPGDAVSFGYVAISPAKEAVCAIRGTHATDILEWLDDAAAVLIPTRLGMVHAGFWGVYESLKSKEVTVADYLLALMDSNLASCVTIAGHSLGGSLATLLARDLVTLDIRIRTFASPRTGDKNFADAFNELVPHSERYEHHVDIVPMLPTYPFWHVGQKIRLSGDDSLSVAANHELTTYVKLLEAKVS